MGFGSATTPPIPRPLGRPALTMLRRGGAKLLQQLQSVRHYAAEAALAEESAFLKFGSPFAPALNMTAALAQLPETQVRLAAPGRTSAVYMARRAALGALDPLC